MKRIEDRLTPPAAPEPPDGLLEQIQKEIPDHLHLVEAAPPSRLSPARLRLIAASVAVVVLGGFLALRVAQEKRPTLDSQVALRNPAAERDSGGRIVAETATPDRVTESGKGAEIKNDSLSALGYIASTDEQARQAYEQRVQSKRQELQSRQRSLEPKPDTPQPVAESQVAYERQAREAPAQLQVPQRNLQSAEPESPSMSTEQILAHEQAERDRGARRKAWLEATAPSESVAQDQGRFEMPPREYHEVPADAELESIITVTSESPLRREVSPAPQAEGVSPSTGGTQEPNDAPYGDMFFKSYGTNPFVDTEVDTQSTFGLDVDTGSYTLARSYIERGDLPPGEAIRVEEFVNYFDYDDPAPRRGEFTLTAEGAPSPFTVGPRYYLVRFGIKGREISAAERKPAMLIFVVDVSGSMQRENRLGLVKRSLDLLLDQLQPEDQVGLVVYGSRGRVLLEPTGDRYAIERAIDQLVPSGSTNAEQGLTLAYDLARTYRRRGAINRIILCSDGVANVGRTGPDSILERIQWGVDQGIELTTVGFGMGNYNDVLMEQLADKGDGSYAYVDTLDEARRIFVENLTGTLQTIASDAKVQVEFDPDTVSLYRLLGYENRDIPDHLFRDDTVDAGEIGAGHEVTALYEIKLKENVGRRDRLATLRLRYRSKETDRVVETALELSQRNFAKRWKSATPALRLSSVVAEFAEILKGSHWAKGNSLEALEQRVAAVAADYRGNQQVQDLLDLVWQARCLAPASVAYGEDE